LAATIDEFVHWQQWMDYHRTEGSLGYWDEKYVVYRTLALALSRNCLLADMSAGGLIKLSVTDIFDMSTGFQ
jgi:accessory colonization factor AcfC